MFGVFMSLIYQKLSTRNVIFTTPYIYFSCVLWVGRNQSELIDGSITMRSGMEIESVGVAAIRQGWSSLSEGYQIKCHCLTPFFPIQSIFCYVVKSIILVIDVNYWQYFHIIIIIFIRHYLSLINLAQILINIKKNG